MNAGRKSRVTESSWKRVVATREFYSHEFPAPHIDSVESMVDQDLERAEKKGR